MSLFTNLPDELNFVIAHFLPLDKMLELSKDSSNVFCKIIENPFYYKSRALFKHGINGEKYDEWFSGWWRKWRPHDIYPEYPEEMKNYLKTIGTGDYQPKSYIPIYMETCYDCISYFDDVSVFVYETLKVGDLDSFKYYFYGYYESTIDKDMIETFVHVLMSKNRPFVNKKYIQDVMMIIASYYDNRINKLS